MKRAQILPGLAAVALVAALAGCGSGTTTPAPATVTVTATPTPASPPAVATTTQAALAGPATSFGNGTHIVGTDIAAGTYRTAGPSDPSYPLCAYERMKDLSGDLVAANLGGGNTPGPAVITIKATDAAFQSLGCQTWTKVK